jgi:WD40 repeat protein
MPGQWKPIQFSPDGSRLVTLYDRQAILYETSRGQFIAVLQQNPRQDGDNLSGARFSADSTRIVISSSVRTSFYSAADGHAFPQRKGDSPTMGTPASGMGGTFATRGSAVAAFDGCIKLMEDKPEWRWLPAAQTGTDIADFRFTPDGNSLIIWHLNGTATRLGLRDGSHGNTNAPPLDRTAAPSRFSADGTRVCLSPDPNGGSSVQVLTKSNQQIEGTIAPSPEPFTYARFVTGTDLILTLNNAGTAQLWKYPRPPSVWDWIVVPKFCLMLATSTALLVSIRRDAREGRYRLRFPAADRRANWKMRYLVGITAIASLHLLGTLAFVISEAAPGRDNLLWVGVGPDGGHEPSAFAIRLANLYELPILNVFVQNQGGWYPDVQFIISSALNAAIWGLGCIALWQAITALRRSSAP